jgi:hypothetical protein
MDASETPISPPAVTTPCIAGDLCHWPKCGCVLEAKSGSVADSVVTPAEAVAPCDTQ